MFTVLASKPDDLGLIPKNRMVEDKTDSISYPLSFTRVPWYAPHTYTYTQKKVMGDLPFLTQ